MPSNDQGLALSIGEDSDDKGFEEFTCEDEGAGGKHADRHGGTEGSRRRVERRRGRDVQRPHCDDQLGHRDGYVVTLTPP